MDLPSLTSSVAVSGIHERKPRRMSVVVCPHQMVMGGSQLNALELAAAVRDLGHDVAIFAPDGVLADHVHNLNLDWIRSPDAGSRLSLPWVRSLVSTVRERDADLVHAYEWAPAMGAVFGPHLWLRKRLVLTVLSMEVPKFLPVHLPLIVGTAGLAAAQSSRSIVHLMEPPIDTVINRPRDPSGARWQWGVAEDEIALAVVGRLTTDLEKLEGVLVAVDVVGRLAKRHAVTLLVAGDGEGLEAVRKRAREVNARHERPVVRVLGNVLDPSSVYEAADIVLGMGSSALKGMAFVKPLIVQGAGGYWRLLTPETLQLFLDDGWFGHGGAGPDDLESALTTLIKASPAERSRLGRFGREVIEQRFSLRMAAQTLEGIYRTTLAAPLYQRGAILSLLHSILGFGKYRLQGRLDSLVRHSTATQGSS